MQWPTLVTIVMAIGTMLVAFGASMLRNEGAKPVAAQAITYGFLILTLLTAMGVWKGA